MGSSDKHPKTVYHGFASGINLISPMKIPTILGILRQYVSLSDRQFPLNYL
jgi:hypothetical protein